MGGPLLVALTGGHADANAPRSQPRGTSVRLLLAGRSADDPSSLAQPERPAPSAVPARTSSIGFAVSGAPRRTSWISHRQFTGSVVIATPTNRLRTAVKHRLIWALRGGPCRDRTDDIHGVNVALYQLS